MVNKNHNKAPKNVKTKLFFKGDAIVIMVICYGIMVKYVFMYLRIYLQK